jgi:uncharacterized protein DUF4412
MKKIFSFSAALILIGTVATAQSFEGTIDFQQYNGVDTTYYKYYVKGDKVKVDNYDPKTNNDEGDFLIDLTSKKTTALSPVRKVYFDQPPGAAVKPGGTPTVTKTGKVKTINGLKCTEYLVVDADEGLKIHFWMAAGHYDFFSQMLQILNRKDKFSEYYLVMTGVTGMFPMLAEEEDTAGNPKGWMKAVKVDKGTIAATTFDIPKGYKEFKK